MIDPGCRVGGGVLFLFVPILVIRGLVFLGTFPAPDPGVPVHLLNMSPPFVTARLEADMALPCLWGESWLLASYDI